jgi:hypothetical protein
MPEAAISAHTSSTLQWWMGRQDSDPVGSLGTGEQTGCLALLVLSCALTPVTFKTGCLPKRRLIQLVMGSTLSSDWQKRIAGVDQGRTTVTVSIAQ